MKVLSSQIDDHNTHAGKVLSMLGNTAYNSHPMGKMSEGKGFCAIYRMRPGHAQRPN